MKSEPEVVRKRAIQRRDAEVGRRPGPREHVVDDEREPVPLPDEVGWNRAPPDRRLVGGEVRRGGEEDGER